MRSSSGWPTSATCDHLPQTPVDQSSGRDYDSDSMNCKVAVAIGPTFTSRSHAYGRRPTMPRKAYLIDSSILSPVRLQEE
jgi:hypothetical protein